MNTESSEKLFGKYHDIFILVLGFMLTSIVGGYLSYSWQSRAAEIDRIAEHKRLEIQSATRIFEETSQLMDKRLYRMRRISMGYGNQLKSEPLEKRWDSYREVLFDWNESLNRNLALVQMYFGEDARQILERDIQQRFISFGSMLENVRNSSNSNSYEKRLKVADDLNNYVYNFDLMLIEKIQSGKVGKFQ